MINSSKLHVNYLWKQVLRDVFDAFEWRLWPVVSSSSRLILRVTLSKNICNIDRTFQIFIQNVNEQCHVKTTIEINWKWIQTRRNMGLKSQSAMSKEIFLSSWLRNTFFCIFHTCIRLKWGTVDEYGKNKCRGN